jgi:hypothetical protein
VSADNLKWRINRAVRSSNLPPTARLIMFVLSDMADAKTGKIPERQSPSLADLARDTGHGESTVKAQLLILEQLGWVVRSRPDKRAQGRYASTGYRLQVGASGEERTPHKRARSRPSEETQEGQELAHSEGQEQATSGHQEGQEIAPRGPGDSSERARSRPPYIEDDDPYDQDDLKASATDVAERPAVEPQPKLKRKPRTANPTPPPDPAIAERRQFAEEIVRWWWNGLEIKPAGKNAWFASVATVEALLKVGYERRDVAGALRAAGKPATIARLEIELEKHGRRPSGAGRGSNDQHLADEMEWARQLEAEEAARQQPTAWEEIPA